LPAAEGLLFEQPRGLQRLVLEREPEGGAPVRLVLGEARIGAVEQLVESLLGVALLGTARLTGPSASAITALTSFERDGK